MTFPITAFTEDSLYVFATKLGTLLMLDSYTSIMKSYGRSSYVHATIELRADPKWKHSLVVAVPKFKGEVYTMHTICIEYE